jgi:uncharacterized membrane protein YbhN (UPF0104 family)
MKDQSSLKTFSKWPLYLVQLIVGLLLYLGILSLAGVDLETMSFLQTLDWSSLFFSFLLTLLLTGFISIRWALIANGLAGVKVLSQVESYFYVLAGRTIGFVLPKDLSDMVVRTLFLARRNKVALHVSTSSLILDKMLDLIVSLVFLGPALLYFLGQLSLEAAVGLLLVAVGVVFLVLLFGSPYVLRLIFFGYNLASGLMLRLLRRQPRPIQAASLPSKVFALGYLASVAKQLCIGMRAFFLGQAVGIVLSPLAFLFGASITQMSYVVSVTPDGLGVYDAAWYGVLSLGAIAEPAIGSFLILQRVFVILVIGALTLLAFGLVTWRRGMKPESNN